MKRVTALELRQSVKKILLSLKKDNQPLLLCQGKIPAAVIISLEDYKNKFHEKVIHEKRKKTINQIKILAKSKGSSKLVEQMSSEEILRSFRLSKN